MSSPATDRFAEVIAKLEAVAAAKKDLQEQCLRRNQQLWEGLQPVIRARGDLYSAGLALLIYKHYVVTDATEPTKVNGFNAKVILSIADEHNDMLHPEVSLHFKVSGQAELLAAASGVSFATRIMTVEGAVLEEQIIAAVDDFIEVAMLRILADPSPI